MNRKMIRGAKPEAPPSFNIAIQIKNRTAFNISGKNPVS